LIEGVIFTPEEILIFREAKAGTQAMSNRFISIDIDTVLDQNLINEGLAREIVNRIQKSRKDSNFNVGDRINVTYFGDEALLKVVDQFRDYIAGETLAVTMDMATSQQELLYEIDEYKFSVNLKKS
jgi:isoleucyl-tRNA synthetase